MKFNLSKRITLGYIFIILVAICATTYSIIVLHKNKELDKRIQTVYLPLYLSLKDLSVAVNEATRLTSNWTYQPTTREKKDLTDILDKTYPALKKEIQNILTETPGARRDSILTTFTLIDTLTNVQREIMNLLSKDDLYEDYKKFAVASFLTEERVQPLTVDLNQKFRTILYLQKDEMNSLQEEKKYSDTFLSVLLICMIIVFIMAFIVAYVFFQKTIVAPIVRIKELIVLLSKGKAIRVNPYHRSDEIGEMMLALHHLIRGMNIKSEFAYQVGQGNYSEHLELLSEDDSMGRALLNMRDNLKRNVEKEQKQAHENKQLALVVNNTTNIVVLADNTGTIEWVNPAFSRITGYTAEEVIGQKMEVLVQRAEINENMLKAGKTMIHEGQGFKDVEFINYTRNGNAYWLSVEVQPVVNKSGSIIQFIFIGIDISDRKAAQKALEDRNEELVKINNELDRFVYSASHDLRAPISSLLGLIEVARLEHNVENIRSLMDRQQNSLLRLDRFIREIVDYSRNSRLKVDSEPIDFQHLVNATFEQLQFMENLDKIKKVIAVQQTGSFYSSPTRVGMVLNNLISNGIKYADFQKTEPLLKIQIKADNKGAEIRVGDNGEGIPEDAREKIFNMFYRASEKSSGSGLGLYIAKEAVQKIGGTVMVDSEYGQWTEFVVTIPGQNTMELA